MPIQPGQTAPDFTLYNSEREPVSLSAQQGHPVVLLFFPLAFTSVCTAELCAVRDQLSWYDQINARVFGISVDSPQSLARFKADQALNFSLLSDFNKEVSTAYDCLYAQFGWGMKGVSKRAAFVIDATGIVRYAEVLENAGEQPDFNKIKAALEALH